jgi:hypothetical protein
MLSPVIIQHVFERFPLAMRMSFPLAMRLYIYTYIYIYIYTYISIERERERGKENTRRQTRLKKTPALKEEK